jgi:hypothetical protein
MNYKILSLILGIICIVLGINFYRLQKFNNAVGKPAPCAETAELDKLRMEKISWQQREDQFLKENGALTTENNELKMQINQKPVIIYKNVQKQKVNVAASKSYTSTLIQRYGAEN